jgi:hypothetical protein
MRHAPRRRHSPSIAASAGQYWIAGGGLGPPRRIRTHGGRRLPPSPRLLQFAVPCDQTLGAVTGPQKTAKTACCRLRLSAAPADARLSRADRLREHSHFGGVESGALKSPLSQALNHIAELDEDLRTPCSFCTLVPSRCPPTSSRHYQSHNAAGITTSQSLNPARR